MAILEKIYSLKDNLNKYTKRSIFPFINYIRETKINGAIEKLFNEMDLDKLYSYGNIRQLGIIYHQFINLYEVSLPSTSMLIKFFYPEVKKVIMGNDYVEISTHFMVSTDKDDMKAIEHRYIFRDNGIIEISYTSYHNDGSTLSNDTTNFQWLSPDTLEYMVLQYSFVEMVKLLCKEYIMSIEH